MLTEYCQRYAAVLDGRSETIVHDLSGKTSAFRHSTEFHVTRRGKDSRYISERVLPISQRDGPEDRTEQRYDYHNHTQQHWCVSIPFSFLVADVLLSGVSGSLLIPQEPFELLVRRSIKTLLEPAIKCKDFVQEELLRIANESFPRELSRFVSLQKKLLDATSEFIRAGGLPAEEMIKNLIDCEYDYINYDHADFIGGSNAVAEVLSDRSRRFPQRSPDAQSSSQNGQTPAPMQHPPVVMRNLRNPVMESIGAPIMPPGLKVARTTDPALWD